MRLLRWGAIVGLIVAAAGCGSSTMSAVVIPRANLPVDSPLVRRLRALAVSAAASNHTSIAYADAVQSTHARAVQFSSGDIVMDNKPVWLIQVVGTNTNTCDICSRPSGAKPPTGRVMQMIVDAKTFSERDGGLVNYRLDLSKLGRDIVLVKQS